MLGGGEFGTRRREPIGRLRKSAQQNHWGDLSVFKKVVLYSQLHQSLIDNGFKYHPNCGKKDQIVYKRPVIQKTNNQRKSRKKKGFSEVPSEVPSEGPSPDFYEIKD